MRKVVSTALAALVCLLLPWPVESAVVPLTKVKTSGTAKRPLKKKSASKSKRTTQSRQPPIISQSGRYKNLKSPQDWLKTLSIRQKVAQLVIVQFYGENPVVGDPLYDKYAQLVTRHEVGGFILINKSASQQAEPIKIAKFLNNMQSLAAIPLLVGGDFERGASMRVQGTIKYPHAMAYGAADDVALTRQLGAATAAEARKLGVHWIYIPVADVNNNPDNPIINIRSFGEDAAQVSGHVKAYLDGARSNPIYQVLTSAKHFPGHGDTNVDSHSNMPQINAPMERLQNVELPPFKAAIAAKVDSVMVAHVNVPALDPAGTPSSVSKPVITGLLREGLGFEGLVVSDAMDMKGLTKMFPAGEAAVKAIEAGMDVLLIPEDAEQAITAVTAAVESKRISQARLDASVLRVLQAKWKLQLHNQRYVHTANLNNSLIRTSDAATALDVARRAVTLVQKAGSFPLNKMDSSACYLALTERANHEQGDEFLAQIRARTNALVAEEFGPNMTNADIEKLFGRLEGCSQVTVAGYLTYGPRGGSQWLGSHKDLMERLNNSVKPITVIAMGSPYTLRNVDRRANLLAAFSTVPVSERAVVEALFAEIMTQGKLPVTIPGVANRGQGIRQTPLPQSALP
jgi:beta-N-acetylhexosaminidase